MSSAPTSGKKVTSERTPKPVIASPRSAGARMSLNMKAVTISATPISMAKA